MSHLLQMRGLKLKYIDIIDYNNEVASFTDAWIETLKQMLSGAERLVASFTDAWIETTGEIDLSPEELSHLLQMRGLKLRLIDGHIDVMVVASFTDAWIETGYTWKC